MAYSTQAFTQDGRTLTEPSTKPNDLADGVPETIFAYGRDYRLAAVMWENAGSDHYEITLTYSTKDQEAADAEA